MPTHSIPSTTASALMEFLNRLEAAGETVIQVVEAGDSWVAVTRPKPQVGRPKKIER